MASMQTDFLLHLLLLLSFFHCLYSSHLLLTDPVYLDCDHPNVTDPGTYKTVTYILKTLLADSSTNKFNTRTIGGEFYNSSHSITAQYQCRGDLNNRECYTCMTELLKTIGEVCRNTSVYSRIQLGGCSLRYEVLGFQHPPVEPMIKCSSRRVSGSWSDRVKVALSQMTEQVSKGEACGGGGEYHRVLTEGQCNGDLGHAQCATCLKNATEIAETECQNTISGGIYLPDCYITYQYYTYTDSVADAPGADSRVEDRDDGGFHHRKKKSKKTTTTIVIISVVAALLFLFLLLLGFLFLSRFFC